MTLRRPKLVARGTPVTKQHITRQISCRFYDETIDEVYALAVKKGTSFAEMLRILTELGLETMKEM